MEQARSRVGLYAVIAVLVLLVLGLAGFVFASALSPQKHSGPPATGSPTPGASAAVTSPPSASPTPAASGPVASAPPGAKVLPADCTGLFSSGMTATIKAKGLVLNPAWSTTTSPGPAGTSDAKLSSILGATTGLTCYWLPPGGASGTGILTRVVRVTPAQVAEVTARLNELGWSHVIVNGGDRWYFSKTSAAGSYGESHLLRADVWFATRWLGYGPSGYTADMVSRVFG